jgi:hypothetical protein
VQTKHLGHPVGYFADRTQRRAVRASDPAWQACRQKSRSS